MKKHDVSEILTEGIHLQPGRCYKLLKNPWTYIKITRLVNNNRTLKVHGIVITMPGETWTNERGGQINCNAVIKHMRNGSISGRYEEIPKAEFLLVYQKTLNSLIEQWHLNVLNPSVPKSSFSIID